MSDKVTTLSHLPAYHHFLSACLLSSNCHGRRTCHTCHYLVVICVLSARQRNQNCRTLSVCHRFVASFYHHVTNIVVEIATRVVLSYHFAAVMWPSYVRQSNYIVTVTSLSPFFVSMFAVM